MSNTAEKFDAKVSVRSKMHYLVKIKAKLAAHPNCDIMFRNSVFGPWLDTPHNPNDNPLLNYVLQHQVFVPEVRSACPDLIYKIGNQEFHFGRREFCLITGFRCGYLPPEDCRQSLFSYRVFPEKKSQKTKSVKAKELWAVIMDEKRWVALDDEDAVRVCLLAVCELVLMGREEFLNVPPHLLTLAEDFFSWNAYPWGEYMWKYFYQRTVNVVPKHADMHLKLQKEKSKKQATYNLNGFVWALKIWILETFPNSNNWWSKDPNVIPRGLAWSNFRRFEKPDYDRLFVQDPYHIIDLVPTDKEMQQPWFIRSMAFLRGEDVPFIQAVLPNGVVHEKQGAPSIVGEVVQSLNKDVLTDVEPKENCVENDGVQDVVVQDVGEEHDVVQEAYQQLLGDSAEKNVVPESRKLMDAFEALCTEVVDVQPELVPKVDKLRKMFCASLRLPVQPITVKENECDGKKHEEVNLLQANEFCGEQSYVVSEEAKDCYERDPASVAVPANGNHDTGDYMDVEKQLPKYSLENMSAGFEEDDISTTEPSVTAHQEEQKQNMCAATDMSAEKTRINQTMDCATSLEANTSELIGFIQKTNDLDKFIGELTNNEMMKQLMASPPPNGFKENVYGCKRRRRKPGPACVTPYQKQSDTTPLPRKRAKRATNVNKPLEAGQFPTNDRSDSPRIITTEDSDWQKLPVEPFREDLKRHKKCNPCKVTVPGYLKFLLKHGPNEEANKMYKFPWGGCDIVVNDEFWLALLGLDRKNGWLTDMPRTHWALAELQISTGTVTLYDSLAPRKRQKNLPIQENRKWWSSMREKLSSQLPLFLNESGVLQSKGISVGSYEITFNFSKSVPCQAAVYGDCGIWVCLLLHGLTNDIPLVFGNPLQVAIAYRERMVAYFWKHKVLYIHHDPEVEDDAVYMQ
ncbi:phospholipase-like protein [Artemisia annua]|uniref:Phospholipase-like protein n=1 Tax=Artemisia annua TaxID=35608 RepID=A0A2U1KPA7_ARTAN|nr:phospholipase-like protein [Artemisia annua]